MGVQGIDETGNRYGLLVVIGPAEDRRAKNGALRWLCQCDCGGTIEAAGINLRRKDYATWHCGCKKCLPKGVAAFNHTYSAIRGQAKKRGYSWEITKEQFLEISQKACFYCAEPPAQVNRAACNGSFTYNGLDRVDNDKGYTIDNVVPCCGQCNRAKGSMTISEFSAWIEKVHLVNKTEAE